ncbi:MAG: hydantoinase B/oxoprolinase family protein, partial [Pseudomonadota bacterium]
SGGAGARPAQDGLSATPYPSGVRNVPVEITEAITPIVIWQKDYRQDSGGAGKQRGGLGQTMVIANRETAPFGIYASFERVLFPARGRDGGDVGAKGRISLESGPVLRHKGFQVVPAEDRLIVEMPGGGGYGAPRTRAPETVAEDVRNGLVTPEAAREAYAVVVDADGVIDGPATDALRGEG